MYDFEEAQFEVYLAFPVQRLSNKCNLNRIYFTCNMDITKKWIQLLSNFLFSNVKIEDHIAYVYYAKVCILFCS